MKPKKVIFRCWLCPGDVTMLTAAVRDIHKCYPGEFITSVDCTCKALWENNPYVVRFEDHEEPEVEIIEVHYPLINHSNKLPYHFIHGYIADINEKLKINIKPTEFKGDIHLTDEEKSATSQIHDLIGDKPFWIVAAGGKFDYTIKWWEQKRYQEVVDYFKGKIQFVQVGEDHHNHFNLDGVINLRGKTTLRQLVNLVYHSSGILCPVTSLMHLAAAVPCKGPLQRRACVVVAGGREPAQWEQYPGHQFLHTIGALSCCAHGGCWKSRTVALNDDDEKDKSLCLKVVNDSLPKCMDMITSEKVIKAIETYYEGGILEYL